jgi:hypothetical protein
MFHVVVEDASGASVIGMLGSRTASPFKQMNIGQAVRCQAIPRMTRLEERNKTWAPQQNARAANAQTISETHMAGSSRGGRRARLLLSQTRRMFQCIFVTAIVFKAFGKDLALEILEIHRERLENEPKEKDKVKVKVDPEEEFKLLLFLWAVENSPTSKVHLTAAPATTSLTACPRAM